jgi:hypothetical protein
MQTKFEEDPFLCPRCSKVGYCIEKANARLIESLRDKLYTINTSPATDKEISNWVPLRTFNKRDPNFNRKLQKAHDLFHQDEFEQASYMYRDMFVTRNDSDEVRIGLAASLYFMQNYQEAADIALQMSTAYRNDMATRFILQCGEKIKSEVQIENESESAEKVSEKKDLVIAGKCS